MEAKSKKAADDQLPLTFNIAKWYGYIFAICYLLYGGASIVLGVLDRKYDDMIQPFIFLLGGMVFMWVAVAFAEGEKWGWKGLLALNCLVIVGTLFSLGQIESYVLILLSLGALAALLAPATKACLR